MRFPAVDQSEAEFTRSYIRSARSLMLPIGDRHTVSLRGDGFVVALAEQPEPHALVCVGLGGIGAYHVGTDAASLRAFAAQALRAADLLDQGKGKQ